MTFNTETALKTMIPTLVSALLNFLCSFNFPTNSNDYII